MSEKQYTTYLHGPAAMQALLERHLEADIYIGRSEAVEDRADKTANALARLVAVLHERGILSTVEVGVVLNKNISTIETDGDA